MLKQLLKRLPKSVQAPPEPPPELEMLGYDLVAPDGLEGVINNPALMPATETAKQAPVNANAATGEIIDEPDRNEPEMPPPSDDDDDSPF